MTTPPDTARDAAYWRSVATLEASRIAVNATSPEFPEGADLPPDVVSRRHMLGLTGATLSIAGLAACRRPAEKIVPYVKPPEEIVPGIPRRYATTMPFGRSAYGLVVESHEGRPTKVEGNELHPATRGASSAWMQSAIFDLYDPDRAGPVQKGGAPSTWAEFDTFWRGHVPSLRANQGAGLAVLAEPFTSPTLARLRARFLETFPRARWATYEPLSDENQREGVASITGRSLESLVDYERAHVVVAIDADPFGTDLEAVRNTGGFASRRALAHTAEHETSTAPELNRLYVAENGFTATGGLADHRMRLRRGRMPAVVALLARELGLDAPALPGEDVDSRWVAAAAKDLRANRGRSAVVAGAHLPPAVHAWVLAINAALGNLGTTLSYREPRHATRSALGELTALVSAIQSGEVSTLVILGGNPAYDAPSDLAFANAVSKVATCIRAGAKGDETSAHAHWHLPLAHFLESWGDAATGDGTLSVVQPLVLPLHGARSAVELLGALTADPSKADLPSGYELVRDTWRGLIGDAEFDSRWERVLHDGVLAASATANELDALPAGATPAKLVDSLPPPSAGAFELVLAPSFSVYDGRFANISWLQELPDLTTKQTWGNAALLSYATARALGVNDEDVVAIAVGDAKIEIPVVINPGQAEHTVTVALGYGRESAGRIGSNVGANAYRLRSTKTLAGAAGARIERLSRSAELGITQDHWIIDELGAKERDRRVPTLIREATLTEFQHEPEFAKEMVEHPPLESLWQERAYADGPQWGMTIDLNVCTGCNACVTACQAENNIPAVGRDQVRRGRELHWIRVDRYFRGDPDDPEAMVVQPIPCMQCENAPCEQVCPVAATVHDDHGLNAMVYNRCIGTRYCSNNCPYKVRRFNYYNFTKDTPETLKMAMNPNVTVRARGVMEKCTYCLQRISAGQQQAKLENRPLADGDVRTACQQACPARAIEFGDIRDAKSRVTAAKASPRNYDLLAELNTKPRTSYLARIRNPHPDLEKA